MKILLFTIGLVFSLVVNAQQPQIHIPAANISVYGENICSDGNTMYYLSRNNSTSVVSLFKLVGNATIPTLVKEVFKEDTAGLLSTAGNFETQLKGIECVNGIFYMMYVVKPSLFSASFTGWRLLTSDGTAAGTQITLLENVSIAINGSIPYGLFRADDGVYIWTNKFVSSSAPQYQGKLYKSSGTAATSILVTTTAADEESFAASNFNFGVKNNWVYFSTIGAGTASTKNRYYRSNGTTTVLIKEVNKVGIPQFKVSDNDMLVAYGDTYLNTTLGLTIGAWGYKKIGLTSGFPELATFAPPNSSSLPGGYIANVYGNLLTTVNGTYYIEGNNNNNKVVYRINPDNTLNFWQFPLNVGFTFDAPLGELLFKRSQNRVYMSQHYSTHRYSTKAAYAPLSARTSSLYYLAGSDPVLIDSINALQGTISAKTNFCGDVVYNETEYNSIYPYSGDFLKQNKLWRSNGSLLGSGFYTNLHDCTPPFAFALPDLNPKGFIKHGGDMLFLGTIGCNLSDGVALFKIPTCSGLLPLSSLDFSAVKKVNSVQLNWKTQNEKDVQQFEVLRSTNGVNFEKIAILLAKNNAQNAYDFDDDLTSLLNTNKLFYYKLKQVDSDGKTNFSNIVQVNLANDKRVQVYPNPASTFINLQTSSSINSVVLINANGQTVKVFNKASSNNYDISTVPNGVYSLRIISNSQTQIHKLIIKH